MQRILALTLNWLTLASAAMPLPVIISRSAPVQSETIPIAALDRGSQYTVLYSVGSLSSLGPDARIDVEIRQGSAVLAAKTLHMGDADFYTQFRVPQSGAAAIVVKASPLHAKYNLQVNRWPLSPQVKSAPSHRWQDAVLIPLGKTVFASGDDAEYIPLPATLRKDIVGNPDTTDWYRFEFSEPRPKLIFFQIDLMERDHVPVNVAIYRVVDGKLAEFYEGEDPVTLPHEVQALPGNKFTPRIIKEQGTYYVSVHASHPEYKFRTRVYDVPPYSDPHQAVRTAADYILAAGDSWHANTPRRGGIIDRVSSIHQETSLCVGCHTTHFPQRAQLYAARNGYPVVQRQQLQFLSERFYNNPRPFYGFEQQGAVWARMISAPANVLGRMSHLMDLYEDQVSLEHRPSFHQGINEYLKLYYAGREKLPPDETNGNTPLVSAHEVGWYAWTVTKDPGMGDMISKGEVKNTIDLCYQTLALADIDRLKYKDQIAKNTERILSLQRPDGQWSARFEATQPPVEFETGHALWALHEAGIPVTEPHVAKGLAYLLKRQQPFGGWMDPLQSFENFRTPFRETQFAILALSAYYPQGGRAKGWNSPTLDQLSSNPVQLLEQLDNVWDVPAPAVHKQIAEAAHSNDALIRQAAVEALGRLADPGVNVFLGDPSKMVQRTAAWALRQAYSRQPKTPSALLQSALASKEDRVRWGATRVFAQHFSALAKRPEFATSLASLVNDPATTVRMQAVKGIWQFWFWSADLPAKNLIEDSILAAMAKPQTPWVQVNLRDAVYNLADENVRYLYNNWVPLLARQEDRDRAVNGRLAVESRLAGKFATVLESGPDSQKKALLVALNEFPLRRGDIYDLESDLSKTAPPVYNRIGNDIEQIVFFGDSASRMARAITPLLDSSDPEMRRLAAESVMLVRETRFADVNRIAGPAGANVQTISLKLEKMPEGVEVLHALKPPPPVQSRAAAAGGKAAPQVKLDEAFFRGYVEPILEKRGKDGYACVHCHASHTLFNGTFGTAMNVVDASDPEASLILRKPTSTSESEGVAGSSVLAHGGGVRFAKDSPEYLTILQWIKGAKE
jgi:Squalene-hopene cyclase C-terminal domain